MENKVLNVLSIDFDYFINASLDDRLTYFPDGVDGLVPEIQDLIWSSHYYNGSDKLLGLKFKKDCYDTVLRVFERKTNKYTSSMVCESHKEILKCLDMFEGTFNIVNIDFHHDMFEDSDNSNCGNWVLDLYSKNLVNTFTWIKQPDSPSPVNNYNIAISTQFTTIYKYDIYDIIFLCKSSPWTPPHIDKYFINMSKSLAFRTGLELDLNSILLRNRYTNVKHATEMMQKAFKNGFITKGE